MASGAVGSKSDGLVFWVNDVGKGREFSALGFRFPCISTRGFQGLQLVGCSCPSKNWGSQTFFCSNFPSLESSGSGFRRFSKNISKHSRTYSHKMTLQSSLT